MKKTRLIAITAVMTALYFVLSALFKIPITGHITLDLGYIALMVSAVYLGTLPALFVGAVGALIESTLLGHSGISLGWIAMNAIIGASCGAVLPKKFERTKKSFLIWAVITVLLSAFVGVVVKTLIDCLIHAYPISVKIPSSLAAFITDSIVMLLFGLPICFALKNKIRF